MSSPDTLSEYHEQVESLASALGIREMLEDMNDEEEYSRSHSNCCDALLINGICMRCKEHAGPQTND